MPFNLDAAVSCPHCPLGFCVEDRRTRRVTGRDTKFRLKQAVALACTFDALVPGTDADPMPTRTFDEYIGQFRVNALAAGLQLFGPDFKLGTSALAKVEGDVFELIEAAALWNAAATWNNWMDGRPWSSTALTRPTAVPTPTRKVALVKLPRGYDATRLFHRDVRNRIAAHEHALQAQGMGLGLSCPDIVAIRVPEPITPEFEQCLHPLTSLGESERQRLEDFHQRIEGTLQPQSFLAAIAVKRTTRSDRLYQPLFEANVLKYLVQEILLGAAFRFHVHLGSFAGADVERHYRAASLVSLLRGGGPALAVDRLWLATGPLATAQMILDELPLFPY